MWVTHTQTEMNFLEHLASCSRGRIEGIYGECNQGWLYDTICPFVKGLKHHNYIGA